MPSLRDVRRHIKSVKNIQQITYAMKMVAAARIRRAQNAILSSRPFATEMEEMFEDLYFEMNEEDFKKSAVYELFENKTHTNSVGLVLITSDKGLCGSFNTNLLKEAVIWLKENRERKIYAFAIGKKGRDFLRRIKNPSVELVYELIGVFPKITYVHAELLVNNILKDYCSKDMANVTCIYNEFKSLMSQKIVRIPLLPLKQHVLERAGNKTDKFRDFNFEPRKELVLKALLPRYIKAQVYRMLLESQAAELAARMNAMESASKNASELIDALTLKYNKTRQAMITKEIAEIVGGTEALGETT